MLWILACAIKERGGGVWVHARSVSESITNEWQKIWQKSIFQIILNIVRIMIGICWCVVKATKNKKLKDLSCWYLNFFYKKYIATYNITRVCILVIIICHLTSFGTNYSPCQHPPGWLILSTYFKKRAGTGRREHRFLNSNDECFRNLTNWNSLRFPENWCYKKINISRTKRHMAKL